MPQTRSTGLSKSRFVRGWQCHRQLWWSVHEPDAEELKPGKVLQDRFDQGMHVGRIARARFLADQVPSMATDLLALAAKMVDLLPIVRNHVYHPGFKGSFSLEYILSPLVPDLTYNDLAIVDGLVASVEIARLLFVAHLVEERDQLRRDLLAYCERDTWAMVRLVARLRELAV